MPGQTCLRRLAHCAHRTSDAFVTNRPREALSVTSRITLTTAIINDRQLQRLRSYLSICLPKGHHQSDESCERRFLAVERANCRCIWSWAPQPI